MKRDVEQGLLDRENKLAERHQGEKGNGRELNDAAAAADGFCASDLWGLMFLPQLMQSCGHWKQVSLRAGDLLLTLKFRVALKLCAE